MITFNKKLLRYLILLILFQGIIQPIFSQKKFVDSLNKITKSFFPDSIKIDLINEMVIKNSFNYPELAIKYCDIAIEKSAFLNDSFRLSKSLNRKGVAYYYMGDYNSAIEQYFKSILISERSNNKENKISDYNNIGLVLIEENLYRESLEYFFKAKTIAETTNKRNMLARILDNIGISFYSLNLYDSALVYFKQSLTINKQLNQKQTLASNIKNIGNIYFQKRDFPTTLNYYLESLLIYEELDNRQEIAGLLNKIGLVNSYLGKLKDAEKYLIRAQLLNKEINSSTLQLENLNSFSIFYEKKGDFKRTIQIKNRYSHLSDSIQKSDKRKKYEQLRLLSVTSKKIEELNLLKTITAIQEDKIKSQRLIEIGMVILLILSFAVLSLIYYTLKIKNRINKRLSILVEERTAELNLAKDKAEESDRNKSTFLANISHEVRTPMNAIVGFSNLLLKSDLEKYEKEEYIKNLQKGTQDLLKLFDKITYLTQIENNDITLLKADTLFDEIFQSLYQKYQQRISDCQLPVKINYSLPDSYKDRIYSSYPIIIETILDELIDNAVKFTNEGEVSFWIRHENNSHKLFVKDTGVGIESKHKDKIFDKFTKFTLSNCSNNDGPGLGLAIVKKDVELIGGTIHITSNKGEGTVVEITIPK